MIMIEESTRDIVYDKIIAVMTGGNLVFVGGENEI